MRGSTVAVLNNCALPSSLTYLLTVTHNRIWRAQHVWQPSIVWCSQAIIGEIFFADTCQRPCEVKCFAGKYWVKNAHCKYIIAASHRCPPFVEDSLFHQKLSEAKCTESTVVDVITSWRHWLSSICEWRGWLPTGKRNIEFNKIFMKWNCHLYIMWLQKLPSVCMSVTSTASNSSNCH